MSGVESYLGGARRLYTHECVKKDVRMCRGAKEAYRNLLTESHYDLG